MPWTLPFNAFALATQSRWGTGTIWQTLVVGALGGALAAVLAGWDFIRRDVT